MHPTDVRIAAVLLCALLALGAASCSSDDDAPGRSVGSTSTTSAASPRPTAPENIPSSDAIDELAANLPGNAEGAGVVAACTTVSGLASRVETGMSTEDDVKPQVRTLAEKVRPFDAKVADALAASTVGQARDWCVAHAFAN